MTGRAMRSRLNELPANNTLKSLIKSSVWLGGPNEATKLTQDVPLDLLVPDLARRVVALCWNDISAGY